ncbi:MAG: NAD-dependent epimerase/dehydratase family protein, partial [Pyrinomonadaceae bacterium]|nr:NAD-dependent epimerase/dehydratase family protein [Pyrinomonadaceae bacterium]
MDKLNILVTGGAGFIASHLVDALVERGHNVRILDSLVEQVHGGKVPEFLNAKAEFIHADVCDADAVSKALDGIEVVYHQAAEVGVGQSMYEIVKYVKTNDLGTAVLLEEMVKRPKQFKKLVVASSMSIYGEGAYRCEPCNENVNPFLRPSEQLEAHEWEFSCETCGSQLKTIGTSET